MSGPLESSSTEETLEDLVQRNGGVGVVSHVFMVNEIFQSVVGS